MLAPRVRSLILKEFLAVLRDPKARVLLIVPPLIQIFIFSFAATQEARNVTLAILNQDSGAPSRELVERFRSAGDIFSRILPLSGRQQIVPVLDQQRALAVLVIPQDFSRRVAGHRPAHVQFLLDGRQTNAAQIVRGYAERIVRQFGDDLARHPAQAQPVTLLVRRWFNPNLDFIWYTVPSLVCILAMLIALLLTSLSVSREREMGTFEQLLVSPLRPMEILLGKAIPALLLALASACLIMAVAVFAFRIPLLGSLPLLFASLTVFLMSIVGVGLFISSLSLTQQQAILGAFVFMVPAVLLSGFATPIENMPPWLQTITLANPIRWFLVIVRGIFLKDMPAADVFANTWPLAIIAASTLAAAAWLFRRRME